MPSESELDAALAPEYEGWDVFCNGDRIFTGAGSAPLLGEVIYLTDLSAHPPRRKFRVDRREHSVLAIPTPAPFQTLNLKKEIVRTEVHVVDITGDEAAPEPPSTPALKGYVLRVELLLDPREARDDAEARETALTQLYEWLGNDPLRPRDDVAIKLQRRHPRNRPRNIPLTMTKGA